VDLGVDAPRLGEGAWASAAGLAAATAGGDGEIAVGRWGEARLPHAGAPGEVAPATLHLGADLFLDAGTEVAAPLAGEVVATGDRELTIALDPTAAPSGAGFGPLTSESRTGGSGSDEGVPATTLRDDPSAPPRLDDASEPPRLDDAPAPLFLRLAGIESTLVPGDRVEPGAPVGRVAGPAADRHPASRDGAPEVDVEPSPVRNPLMAQMSHTATTSLAPLPPHLHVQLALAPGLPGLGDPRHRDAWLALCPDPSPLLGTEAAAAPPPPDPAAERARREAVLAGAQGLYYREPPEIVRGWRATLFDSDARPYVDVVNNVAAVGHSHPGVTAAATEQLRLLNTNSRFLYDSLTEYAERVAALLPPEIDRVFVVNSGSEALDLAVQLGRVYTGRRDLAAIFGAYHGWTESVYEACTSPQDNPGWRDTVPPWIHVVDQPDPNRGVHGADAGAYVDSVRAACAAAEPGGGIAAFLSEALLGNQGAVVPPPGYLAAAYEAVRAAGGVCIADEVQVGYARTGSDFWAFEHEGVVPDIVATAKATGNGHPIGVVACRAEIAEAFGRRASFFSSTGGGPVSCRVGIAVLDAIRDEGLQARAAAVGGHLKAALERLAERHPAIGAVNGRGLYLGVDIVADRASKEPAPAETAAICERLRGLGVIVQPTGDFYNFLKVKPPMCIGTEEADHFVAMLDRVLDERERIAAMAL
jgi:4-aminobutyrate aminotransferase-like enzyme